MKDKKMADDQLAGEGITYQTAADVDKLSVDGRGMFEEFKADISESKFQSDSIFGILADKVREHVNNLNNHEFATPDDYEQEAAKFIHGYGALVGEYLIVKYGGNWQVNLNDRSWSKYVIDVFGLGCCPMHWIYTYVKSDREDRIIESLPDIRAHHRSKPQ